LQQSFTAHVDLGRNDIRVSLTTR